MQKYLLTFWVNDGESYEGGIAVRRLLLFLRQLLLKYWITKCLLVRRILANFATLFDAAHIDGIRGERERLLGVWEREREWILDNSNPKVREREGNGKNPVPKFRSGKGTKKTYSHNSGTGIRGFHSWEWTGTGIPAYPWMAYNSPICLLVIFNCYESRLWLLN